MTEKEYPHCKSSHIPAFFEMTCSKIGRKYVYKGKKKTMSSSINTPNYSNPKSKKCVISLYDEFLEQNMMADRLGSRDIVHAYEYNMQYRTEKPEGRFNYCQKRY